MRLSSEKDIFFSVSTLKTKYGVDFIRHDLNITDYDAVPKEARKK